MCCISVLVKQCRPLSNLIIFEISSSLRFFGFAGHKRVVVYNRARHSIDLDHVAAHPIGALAAYADLAEFQPRRGSSEARFAS